MAARPDTSGGRLDHRRRVQHGTVVGVDLDRTAIRNGADGAGRLDHVVSVAHEAALDHDIRFVHDVHHRQDVAPLQGDDHHLHHDIDDDHLNHHDDHRGARRRPVRLHSSRTASADLGDATTVGDPAAGPAPGVAAR